MKRWQKHLIAWSVVLIVITAALIHGPDANPSQDCSTLNSSCLGS